MTDVADVPRRILVTGASGAVGTPVCAHLLRRGHQVRGFSLEADEQLHDVVVGSLSDGEAVRRAAADRDTIIHLAAFPDPADFIDVLLEPNVVGLHHICEAAVEVGARRLILASTLQVISGLGRDGPVRIEDGVAPTNHYALTKVWAEEAGRMVARVHGLPVILVRIGWFPRNTKEARHLGASGNGPDFYFSHDDAGRFFERCVESDTPGAGESITTFATSRPATTPRLDLTESRRCLGYEPQDTWPAGIPFAHE